MPLTPQDIIRKEFREAFRGYNQSDVDLFLDEVAEEYRAVVEENQRYRMRVTALQQEIARLKSSGAVAPSAAPSGAGAEGDARRLDREVRARVRRFLEEQLRLLEQSEAEAPPTAERVAREAPRADAGPPQESDTRRFWSDER